MQTAEQPVDFAGRPVPPHDIARLKKEPTSTRVEPLHDDTRNALRDWRPPKHAYVLFERWRIETLPNYTHIKTYGLFVFNVEARPEQMHKIEFFLRKGFRILDWGNFHYISDKQPESARMATMHNNAWASLETELERLVVQGNEIRELRDQAKSLASERDALAAKVREYEAKRGQAASKPATIQEAK